MTEETHTTLRKNDSGVKSRSDINYAVDTLTTVLEAAALGMRIFSIRGKSRSLLNNLRISKLRQEIRICSLVRQ
jgi:hypothetical protein